MQVGTADSAVTSAASRPTVSATSTLGYNDFLKLLLAQMKNQDPTSPTDSTQWVSQLATFSSVEQAVQANSKLDQILQNSALTDAESLIGRTVTTRDQSVSGVVAAVSISNGSLVATLESGESLPVTTDVTISQ